MKNTIVKLTAAVVALASFVPAAAAETLIFSNEVLEQNANTMILDFDDTLGDVTLQFGQSLGEKIFWDSANGMFNFTDDIYVEGDIETAGALRVDTDGSNGYIELVGDANSDGDWDLVINNDGVTADLLVTAGDLKKLVDLVSDASEIDDAVNDSHTQNTDTGTDNPYFRVDSSTGAGYIEIVDGELAGNYNLSINNNGMSTDIIVTGADLEKLVDITSTAAQIDAAVAASHDQNTDTGTDADTFNVNTDGVDATVQFGSTTDGEITYDDSESTFDFDGNTLSNVADPASAQDAATKNYVDGLVNGLYWRDPIEKSTQLVDGTSGGIRAGGKIYIEDESLVVENDTIVVTYNDGGSTFTLTAKDAPTASSCEFASGATATDNTAMASSILSAIQNCAAASDFASFSSNGGPAVYFIHYDTSAVGNGTITVSGSGLIDIDMHDGRSYADMLDAETRITRSDQNVHTWDYETDSWITISNGTTTVPDATTTVKGKVELATDGETAAGVVVQGNDSRLHDQNTDAGTDNATFTVDSTTGDGSISIADGEQVGNYDLTINNNGMSTDVTVTGADLEKLVDLTSTAAQIDAAVAGSHDQNTDIGTDNSSFRVNTDTTGGYIDIVGNQSGSDYTITVNNAGLTSSITVTGADLQKLVNISSSAAQIDAAVTNSHAQNTDSGTTADNFVLNLDNTAVDFGLQFGSTLNEKLFWDDDALGATDGAFTFTDDLVVEGSLTLGSSTTVDSVIDDDTMATASATSLSTSESVKAYVDNTTSTSAAGKADKVTGATDGNLAGLDATGNLTDSGVDPANVALLDGTQEFTGTNTLNDVVLNGAISGTSLNTDDTLTTVSDTEVASSEAIKTYVDSSVSGISTHTQNTDTGTDSDSFEVNTDGTDATLEFGNTVDGYITYTNATDTFDIQGNVTTDGTINGVDMDTTGIDFNGDATIGTSANTIAIDSTNWNIASDGTTTGLIIDGNTNTITNLDFTNLGTRVKTLPITMNNMTVYADGTDNACNVYSGSEGGLNPHEFYQVKSYGSTPQDIDVRIKVKLPEDFEGFDNAGDLSFNYRNTAGQSAATTKVDITVSDGAGNLAWNNSAGTPAVGLGMYSGSWANFATEFDTTGSFNPSAGDYIYITIKGYATKNGAIFSEAFLGELYLTYTGK